MLPIIQLLSLTKYTQIVKVMVKSLDTLNSEI